MENRYQEKARKIMVDEQLAARGISDKKVLNAFLFVPRHNFVPFSDKKYAYEDQPLSIGAGQTISQPYMVALMTESLKLSGGEKVLEIGTGSGYQSAILAEICGQVITVERKKELLDKAKETLTKEGYKNIEFLCGDGSEGAEEYQPFDGIIVTASVPRVPETLTSQLKPGGRLILPIGDRYQQILVSIERRKDDFKIENICGCIFVPLIGKYGWEE